LPEERVAIARSKSAAARGEFTTEEQVRAVWVKHGLEAVIVTPLTLAV
jgi:hypothetical protein